MKCLIILVIVGTVLAQELSIDALTKRQSDGVLGVVGDTVNSVESTLDDVVDGLGGTVGNVAGSLRKRQTIDDSLDDIPVGK